MGRLVHTGLDSSSLVAHADDTVHETPNLRDWNAEFRNAESHCTSDFLTGTMNPYWYNETIVPVISLLVRWLTEPRFGISKFGIPIEIRTLKINNQQRGNSGVWNGDYGWGVRVRRPFGAPG
jgi:hypothetical protein